MDSRKKTAENKEDEDSFVIPESLAVIGFAGGGALGGALLMHEGELPVVNEDVCHVEGEGPDVLCVARKGLQNSILRPLAVVEDSPFGALFGGFQGLLLCVAFYAALRSNRVKKGDF